MDNTIKHLLLEAKNNPSILAIVLFGSKARGDAGPLSDTDLCIIAPTIKQKDKLNILAYSSDKVDITFFEDLPLNIKVRVIQEGKTFLNKNKRLLDDLFWHTLKEYIDFRIHRAKLIETYLPGASYV